MNGGSPPLTVSSRRRVPPPIIPKPPLTTPDSDSHVTLSDTVKPTTSAALVTVPPEYTPSLTVPVALPPVYSGVRLPVLQQGRADHHGLVALRGRDRGHHVPLRILQVEENVPARLRPGRRSWRPSTASSPRKAPGPCPRCRRPSASPPVMSKDPS